MTQEEKTNTILGIPNEALYYLEKVSHWKKILAFHMEMLPIESEISQKIIEDDNDIISLYSDKFCEAMGWN